MCDVCWNVDCAFWAAAAAAAGSGGGDDVRKKGFGGPSGDFAEKEVADDVCKVRGCNGVLRP